MKIISRLIVSLLVFSWAGYANGENDNEYRRGNRACTDFSEQAYKEDPEDLFHQFMQASCLVIKGQDEQGLPTIYHLSDHNSHIPASLFLGNYLSSDGTFTATLTETNIDEALKYYYRTLALIDLSPNYPHYEDLHHYEYDVQAELKSLLQIPTLFAQKYRIGIMNDSCLKAVAHGYTGDCPTHHGYESLTVSSLEELLRYARECAATPRKKHHRKGYYMAVTRSCHSLEKMALDLMPLEQKRRALLLKDDCKNPADCPAYMSLYDKIAEIREKSMEETRLHFKDI